MRPSHVLVIWADNGIWFALSPNQGGTASVGWFNNKGAEPNSEMIRQTVRDDLGRETSVIVHLPTPGSVGQTELLIAAAENYIEELLVSNRLDALGDISHVAALRGDIERFMDDHPDYEKNVFVIMRFSDTAQMKQIYEAIAGALRERGMSAIRADARDYTGELWSNIEVYLTGCKYGIAVFEDIDVRSFNPNVALELGYMMARKKRCLLLKEVRLPALPVDVVHRLYKPFDSYAIADTVKRQVRTWVDIDLRP